MSQNAPLAPPYTPLAEAPRRLSSAGFAVLDAASASSFAGWASPPADWSAFWNKLPPDQHLRDGGRYRRRRHGSYVVQEGRVRQVAHRAHWQPVEYNALHGGFERWFEPLEVELACDARLHGLLAALAHLAGGMGTPAVRWCAEVHAFRIDCTDGIGRPTPEGAHRDGVDLVAVLLLERHAIRGGETRVFEAHGTQGMRFTLADPFSVLLLDDAQVIHETTPIQPSQGATTAHRDTLVATLRREAFQEPQAMLSG